MKRILLSAVLSTAMAAAGIPALAQTASTPQENNGNQTAQKYGHHGARGAHMRQQMIAKLNLSQQQQEQLQPIFEKQREQMKALRQDTSLTEDQKKQKFAALRQDTQTRINSVLTPEQQQQWAQMKANRKQHMAEGRQKMAARLSEKLNLTQAQQEQLKPIMQKQREQAKSIWQDNSLTEDQKRSKMQALRQDTQAQLSTILTPEQQQQWQQMRQNFRHHRGHGPAAETQPAAPQGA